MHSTNDYYIFIITGISQVEIKKCRKYTSSEGEARLLAVTLKMNKEKKLNDSILTKFDGFVRRINTVIPSITSPSI